MEKNHKIAVIFLPYLKLLLGTERVYSWKKKKNKQTEKARGKQTKSNNKNDMSKGRMI